MLYLLYLAYCVHYMQFKYHVCLQCLQYCAVILWSAIYVINQDEHKIPIDELVRRLETSLDKVSMTF